MYDIKWIREHPAEYDLGLERRNLDAESRYRFSSRNLLQVDEWRRGTQARLDEALARRKTLSEQINQMSRRGETSAANELKSEVAQFKLVIEEAERDLAAHKATIN